MVTTTIPTASAELFMRLEVSAEWAALTNSQKSFVTAFLATGSALEATKAGYKTKSDENARILSYELVKNPTIRAALNVVVGRIGVVQTEEEVHNIERKRLIKMVRSQLRAAEPGSVAAQRFASQLERLVLGIKPGPIAKPEADADSDPAKLDCGSFDDPKAMPATKFHVGQRVTQRDDAGVVHTGIVKAIGPDGLPSQIEEVV